MLESCYNHTMKTMRFAALFGALVATALVSAQGSPARVHSITGTVEQVQNWKSSILGNQRGIWIYLPPGYHTSKESYPVLYMHDGQNLFDGYTSYIPNQEWRVDEAAQGLIKAGMIRPLIIVGIDNAGIDRANEYLPTRFSAGGQQMGGNADKYGDMIEKELMPWIESKYRVQRGPRNTGLCGSSFGGVITAYLGATRPHLFGRLGIVSPSIWYDNKVLLKLVAGSKLKPNSNTRIWIDMGDDEGRDSIPNTLLMRDVLVKKGFVDGKDLRFFEAVGAKHNEAAWAARMDLILLHLFGK